MKGFLKIVLPWFMFAALLAGCDLFPGAASATPVVLPPTQPVVLALPSTVPPTGTPAPVPTASAPIQTPTFPPVITTTPQPTVPTATLTLPPGATKQPGVKLVEIRMNDLNSGWAVGQVVPSTDEQILKTSNGGKNWSLVTPPEPALANKKAVVHFMDAAHAWVVYASQPGIGGKLTQFTVWRTTDGGARWKSSENSLDGLSAEYFTANQIAFADANNGWLMAILGSGMNHTYIAIYKTADGGASWQLIVSPDKNSSLMPCSKSGVWFRDANHGYLAGNCYGVVKGLYLYGTTDGGATWKPVDLPAPAGMPNAFTKDSIACGADAPRFFDAQKGLLGVTCIDSAANKPARWVYQTKDGGASWSSAAMPRSYGSYTFLNSTTGWYLGQASAYTTTGVIVYTTTDGGKTWKQISGTNWGGEMDFVDAKNGWIIARSGGDLALVRTSDGGLTYQVISPQIP
jgi:photosystem II stability/assembly factor-like uncharacterized protein